MSEQNKTIARRWFEEVWNQGSESTIDELFHPQGKACGRASAMEIMLIHTSAVL